MKNNQIPGVTDFRITPVITQILNDDPKTSLLITSSYTKAKELKKNLSYFINIPVHVVPEDDPFLFQYEAKSREDMDERLTAIYALEKGNLAVIIAPITGAVKKMPPKDIFFKHKVDLTVGNEIDLYNLKSSLSEMGFERLSLTEEKGQFSVRGEVIDIFPINSDYPVRLDIFDTEIESIKYFNPETQRSIKKIDEFQVYPAVSFFPGEEYGALETLVDYLPEDSLIFVDDSDRLQESLKLRGVETQEDLKAIAESGKDIPVDMKWFATEEDYYSLFGSHETYFFTPFANKPSVISKVHNILRYDIKMPPHFNGHMSVFKDQLNKYLKDGYAVEIICSTAERVESLKGFLRENEIKGSVDLLLGSLTTGYVIEDTKTVIMRDGDIFRTSQKRKRKLKNEDTKPIRSFSDISVGDYVVHEAHGIGKYVGVEQLTTAGNKKDYFKIKYSGADILFVPVEQMNIIQKFIGGGNKQPKINKLTGSEWQRAKAKAKQDIAAMSKDLLTLSAERKSVTGYAFSPDTIWQRDFEDQFPYTETDDQLRSAESIKRDMEKPYSMDRLLCGDVGYGKTEVAARAVFKCVAEGKQAALLVPTTILASQHYNTFKKRFKDFPFNVEMLSRFRSDEQQREIISKLEAGGVDVVISTHRLLSKDVRFKDLGLLVVDEEQRFGVKHKEIIKGLKKNVDVLTLSATPIPRTLHMSLVGIRDMDLIEEPPEDRYPVQTYVMEETDDIIRETIRREIDRDGQVYIVYNRVRGIESQAQKIMDLIPEAKVAVGHGQMSEIQLENVMMDFINKEYNVLIATTIIESGIDIQNVNTILIIDADKFGLSQLYQLRGRVGRTNRVAYAYLLHKRNKILSEVAEKRLLAIKEFTEFGAGFKIAMRDLEIRGAGNLLGTQQSGHMMTIGYELYCKMVDDAVRSLQGEHISSDRDEVQIDLPLSAYIPDSYIEDEQVKLQVYRDIATIEDTESYEEMSLDLSDRFGQIPNSTINLMKVSLLKSYAGQGGFSKIRILDNDIILEFDRDGPELKALEKAMDVYGERLIRRGKASPYLLFKDGRKARTDELIELTRFFVI